MSKVVSHKCDVTGDFTDESELTEVKVKKVKHFRAMGDHCSKDSIEMNTRLSCDVKTSLLEEHGFNSNRALVIYQISDGFVAYREKQRGDIKLATDEERAFFEVFK